MINNLMVDDKIEYFLVKFHFKHKEWSVSSLERWGVLMGEDSVRLDFPCRYL